MTPRRRALCFLVLIATAGCAPHPVIRPLAASHDLYCAPVASVSGPLAAGAFLGDAARDSAQMANAIARYVAAVRQRPALVKVYYNLATPLGRGTAAGRTISAIVAAGATPLVSIEPTGWSGSAANLLDRIAAGQADAFIRARRDDLESIPNDSIVVELAPEMNQQSGAPWQPRAADSLRAGASYVATWRRIVSIFREAGSRRVRWLWSPSAGNPFTHRALGVAHWNSMERYYPGDDVVDAVGVHAFNDAIGQAAWIPFAELVDGVAADHALSELAAAHPAKPIVLGEVASSEFPGRSGAKAEWITDAFAELRRCPSVRAIVWFDMRKEHDWQFNSSASSLEAYRTAVGLGSRILEKT